MPPPEAAAAETPPAEGGEGGGGNPQEMIQQVDQLLGALSEMAAGNPAGEKIAAFRDAFQALIDEVLSSAGGGAPQGGPTTPEQGASGARPVGPGG